MNRDFSALHPELQVAAQIGLVSVEFARVESALSAVVLALAEAPPLGEADDVDVVARRQWKWKQIVRKPMAQKLDLLKLLWPTGWPAVDPLTERLKEAAVFRNQLDHASVEPDFQDVLAAAEKGAVDPYGAASWGTRSIRDDVFANFDAAAVAAELSRLRLMPLLLNEVAARMERERDTPRDIVALLNAADALAAGIGIGANGFRGAW